MICQFTKEYILEQAKEKNIEIPSNYETILENYCELVKKYGYDLEFRKGRSLTFDNLGANAGCLKNNSIVATPEWAFQLVIKNQDADTAFRITLGHELTHKETQFSHYFSLCNLKYIAWVNEVHADFGAAQKMFNSNRKILIKAIDYKLNYKHKHQKGDIEDFTHPSWVRRKYYVEHFNFDSKLIQQIAKDVGCSNKKLINKICLFYKEIKLI